MIGLRLTDLHLLTERLTLNPRSTVLHVGCGKGLGINELTQRFGCAAYGIEEDLELAREAKPRFCAMIRGELGANMAVAQHAFALVLLPGMSQVREAERVLIWAFARLVPEGVVCTLSPRREAPAFAAMALKRYSILDVCRWQDHHLLFILRRRESFHRPAEGEAGELLKRAPHHPVHLGLRIHVPSAQPGTVTPFRALWREARDLDALLASSNLAQEAVAIIRRPSTAREELPPLPLKQGHIALQLAAGHFDGAVGTGPNRHVVKGRVVRTPVAHEELDEEGRTVTVTQDVLSVVVTAIDGAGVMRRFSSEGAEEKEG